MPEAAPHDVLTGQVLVWHGEEGWGVLTADTFPHNVWAHFSAIQADGFRELTAGEAVTFTAEQAEQDGYRWRAVRVWSGEGTQAPTAPADDDEDGSGFTSSLTVTSDD